MVGNLLPNGQGANPNAVKDLDPSLTQAAAAEEKTKDIGAEEFLQLLVTQLKHQDPLDPMKNEDFAVNLAGYYITDNLLNPDKYRISTRDPELTTIQPKGHLVLVADGDRLYNSQYVDIQFALW